MTRCTLGKNAAAGFDEHTDRRTADQADSRFPQEAGAARPLGDNKPNGRGVQVTGYSEKYGTAFVQDGSDDGHCAAIQGNLFPDGYGVNLYVEEYTGDVIWDNWAHGYGVA